MTGRSLSLQLDFDLDAQPIGGAVVDPEGTRQSFHGWLQLTETIEAARLSALSHPPGGTQEMTRDL